MMNEMTKSRTALKWHGMYSTLDFLKNDAKNTMITFAKHDTMRKHWNGGGGGEGGGRGGGVGGGRTFFFLSFWHGEFK